MAWWNKRSWDVEQLRQWIAVEGKTHQWVADQLQCANQTIAKLCQRHGIPTQRTGPRAGPGHPGWKGGHLIDEDGYVLRYCPSHPHARNPRRKYVLEHRLVMERQLGRYLTAGEVVHHRNGKKDDNRIENLQLFARNGEHLQHELTGRCPKWSDDGKQRIQEGVERWRRSHRALKSGGTPTP